MSNLLEQKTLIKNKYLESEKTVIVFKHRRQIQCLYLHILVFFIIKYFF